MIASCIAPSALVQSVRPCKGTWILWSGGVTNAWGMKFNTKKCQVMPIASGKLHPTYLYNFSAHILSSVQIAKCLWTTLTDEFSWSCHVHSIHSCANSALGFLRRNLRCCISKLRDCIHYVSPFYTGVCSVLNMWCERNPATDWQCEVMQIQLDLVKHLPFVCVCVCVYVCSRICHILWSFGCHKVVRHVMVSHAVCC